MASTKDAVTEVQAKVLDTIKQGQEATLSAVREVADGFKTALPKVPEWTEAFATSIPKLPEWAEAYTPKLPDLSVLSRFEGLIDFTQKIWETQRDFNMALYEAIAPIGRSAFGAAKESAKAAKPAEDAVPTKSDHNPRTTTTKA